MISGKTFRKMSDNCLKNRPYGAVTSTGATFKFVTNHNSILEHNSKLGHDQANQVGLLLAVATDECDWLVIKYKWR